MVCADVPSLSTLSAGCLPTPEAIRMPAGRLHETALIPGGLSDEQLLDRLTGELHAMRIRYSPRSRVVRPCLCGRFAAGTFQMRVFTTVRYSDGHSCDFGCPPGL